MCVRSFGPYCSQNYSFSWSLDRLISRQCVKDTQGQTNIRPTLHQPITVTCNHTHVNSTVIKAAYLENYNTHNVLCVNSISWTVTKCLEISFFFFKVKNGFEIVIIYRGKMCYFSVTAISLKNVHIKNKDILSCSVIHGFTDSDIQNTMVEEAGAYWFSVVGWPILPGLRDQQLSEVDSAWREGEAFATTKQWHKTFSRLFHGG